MLVRAIREIVTVVGQAFVTLDERKSRFTPRARPAFEDDDPAPRPVVALTGQDANLGPRQPRERTAGDTSATSVAVFWASTIA